MGLSFYPAEWLTGQMWSIDLPLTDVQMSRDLDGKGTLTANLDLAQLAASPTDYRTGRAIMDMIRPGAMSIVPVREDYDRLAQQAIFVPMGEWWIKSVARTYSSSVLQISAVELGGWLETVPLTYQVKKRAGDPLDVARTAFRRAVVDKEAGDMPAIYRLSGDTSCGTKLEATHDPGTVTVANLLSELRGDIWEWRTTHSVVMGPPASVRREVQFAVGGFHYEPSPNVFWDATTPGAGPGSRPGQILNITDDQSVDDICTRMWGFGAGSGNGQVTHQIASANASGVPTLHRVLTASDANSTSRLRMEMLRAHKAMDPMRQPFTIQLALDGVPFPVVGGSYYWAREPSLSYPTQEPSKALRVLSWQWTQPRAGERETITLTVERETL